MNKSVIKKTKQLGINPGTARHRLVRDLVFDFICALNINRCFQCGEPMTKDNYSIEHKIPWLDSSDPKGLYFDLNNIDYSHLKCNIGAARSNTPDQLQGYKIMANKRRKHPPKGKSWCSTCKDYLPITSFTKCKARWDGLHNECRECRSVRRTK